MSLARGDVAQEVVDALRLGRMTALLKEDGGVTGIVVGDEGGRAHHSQAVQRVV